MYQEAKLKKEVNKIKKLYVEYKRKDADHFKKNNSLLKKQIYNIINRE